MGCDGEREPNVHAAGIALDRRIEELLDLGEIDDLVELLVDFVPAHAQDGAVEKDILAASKFWMKAGADFEEAADAAAQVDGSTGGLGDARQNLEQRRFTGPVM